MKRKSDPYRDRKMYHMAKLFGPDGRVSALCFLDWMRAIPRIKGISWTINEKVVNCPKCLRRLAAERRIANGHG